MIKNNKAISPVISTVLLLLVVSVSIFSFTTWYTSFSSNLNSNVELKSSDSSLKIENLIGNTLYLKNYVNNMSIEKIKISNKTCKLNSQNKNLQKGMEQINLWDCLSGLKNDAYEVVVFTNNSIKSKNFYFNNAKADVFKGSVDWFKTYPAVYDGFGNALSFDSFGNVYVAGRIDNGNNDPVILKYSSSGNLLFNITDSTGGSDRFQDIKIDSFDNIYVVGDFYNTSSTNDYVRIRKYSKNKIFLWEHLFDYGPWGYDYQVGGVDLDLNGNIYMVGTWYNSSSTNYAILLAKFNSSGSLIWNRTYEKGDSEGFGIKIYNNEIYISGYNLTSSDDPLILKYNSSGSLLLAKGFSNSGWDWAYDVDVDSKGNIYYVGDFYDGIKDYYIVRKLNSTGSIVWDKKYYRGGSSDTAYEIYIDGLDNIYVTGSLNNGVNSDIFTAKFDTYGNQVWNSTYSTSGVDWGEGIIADSSGNIYVTGKLNGQLGIIKYQ